MTRTIPRPPRRRRPPLLAAATATFVLALLASLAPVHALAVGVPPVPAIASEAQAAAAAESCEITPGVDNPTYNNVCPDWVSPITREEIHDNPVGRGPANTGWFTRAAPSGEYVVTAGWHTISSLSPQHHQMVLVATRADTGERLWVRHYPTGVASPVAAPGFVAAVPLAMMFSPDSRYLYIAGWTHHPVENYALGSAGRSI